MILTPMVLNQHDDHILGIGFVLVGMAIMERDWVHARSRTDLWNPADGCPPDHDVGFNLISILEWLDTNLDSRRQDNNARSVCFGWQCNRNLQFNHSLPEFYSSRFTEIPFEDLRLEARSTDQYWPAHSNESRFQPILTDKEAGETQTNGLVPNLRYLLCQFPVTMS